MVFRRFLNLESSGETYKEHCSMRVIIISILLLFSVSAYAYQGDNYTTPDTWSKHITPNGVKASTQGIDFGNDGNLKIGLTTRVGFRFYGDDFDAAVYQYLRAKYTGFKMGEGSVNVNLNMRGAWNNNSRANLREGWVLYDGLYVSENGADADYRLYYGNIEFNKVIPLTDITVGRQYLSTFTGYKIDGINVNVAPLDVMNISLYYGLPVSYYSNLNTQMVGATLDFPIDATGTRVRGEAGYFIYNKGGDYNTLTAKIRVDQKVPTSNIYLEGDLIGKAFMFDAGIDGNIDSTLTGFSAYIMGQAGVNDGNINPYVALYEDVIGDSSEYFMAGFEISQGITDNLMLSFGLEGRNNFGQNYGDRNYVRAFAAFDLIGLIHENNFLEILADYYSIPKKGDLEKSDKVLVGFRMTQKFLKEIEAWVGVNVMNYQYKNSPIRLTQTPFKEEFTGRSKTENNTVAYIGGMYSPTDWCALQLDYTFEYSNLLSGFKKGDTVSTLELWVNFLW